MWAGDGRQRSAPRLLTCWGAGHGSVFRNHPPNLQLPVLLDVDKEYRDKAKASKLPTIAPRRFNPEGKAWLPVLHAHRDHWHFSALYSNTALAHKLERTHDWVVMYYYDDHHQEGQHTVVTETRGPLTGRRVVRGRETECSGILCKHSQSTEDACNGPSFAL